MLNLKPGQKVLDVGCGIGGGDFYMAKVITVVDINNNSFRGICTYKMTNRRKISELWSRSAWPGPFREHGEHCHGEGHR